MAVSSPRFLIKKRTFKAQLMALVRWFLVSLLLLLVALGSPAWGQDTDTDNQDPRVPVELGDQTLFYIRVPVAGYSPETRAQATSKRIRDFARDRSISPESLVVDIDEQTKTYNLLVNDRPVVILTEADAEAIGMDPVTMLYRFRVVIQNEVIDWREARSPRNMLRAVIYSLVALVTLLLSLKLLTWGSGWVLRRLRHWQGTVIPGFSLFGYEFFSAERIVDFIWEVIKILRLAGIFLLLGLFFTSVLSFFPQTSSVSDDLFEYFNNAVVTVSNAFFSYLPNLFFIGIIILITFYVLKVVKFFFTEIQRGHITIPGFYTQWAKPTYNIARLLIIFFAAAVAYPYLPGSSSPAFQGISIFLGALFTLGSSGAIANLVSGVVLIYSRAYEIGDRITINDTTGDVLEKSLFVTRVRTIKNVVVTVPNSVVLGSNITNYTPAKGGTTLAPLVLHTTITLGYDVPWRKVHDVLVSAAQNTPNILEKPLPFVLQTSLDDYYVSYELNAYTEKPKLMAKIYSELHQNIQDKCNEAGIEILSPHYRAVRDGNVLAVPQEYWPEDYTVPSFRVEQSDHDHPDSTADHVPTQGGGEP
jgi:small-conductance mechanosensitive channel